MTLARWFLVVVGPIAGAATILALYAPQAAPNSGKDPRVGRAQPLAAAGGPRGQRAAGLGGRPRPVKARHYTVDWRRRAILWKRHASRLGPKVRKLRQELRELRWRLRTRTVQAHVPTDWRARQIVAAEVLGREGDATGTDPWPNCPDPYDHAGHSWDDTVACENTGSWHDSAGFYRCGLQFDPMWERRFGALCP